MDLMPKPVSTPPQTVAGSGLSRRKFLTTSAAVAGGVAASNLTIMVPQRAQAADSLRILSWAAYNESRVMEEFEDTYKVKLDFKLYVGGEQMLQFYNQVPRGTFDAIITDAEYVAKLNELDAIEAIDRPEYPELDTYHEYYQTFPLFYTGEQVYAIPTRFGFYANCYNTKYFDEEEVRSWQVMFREDLEGKLGLFDWYLPNMGNASLANFPQREKPYDLTDEQLAQVQDWMIRLKPHFGLITPNTQDIAAAFAKEDIWAGPLSDSTVLVVAAEGLDNFTSVIPDEGAIRWTEGAAVAADSPNRDLALEWVKYMTQPSTQARLTKARASKGRAPNLAAAEFMDEDQKQLLEYIPDPDREGKFLLEERIEKTQARTLPLSQTEKIWQDTYNEFKTS